MPLTVGFLKTEKPWIWAFLRISQDIKEEESLYSKVNIGFVCKIHFGMKASHGEARGIFLCFLRSLRCSPAHQPPSVVRTISGIMSFSKSTLVAEERQIIKSLEVFSFIILIQELRLGPEAQTRTGKSV